MRTVMTTGDSIVPPRGGVGVCAVWICAAVCLLILHFDRPVQAQVARDDRIVFRFGPTSIALERSLVRGQPHPYRMPRDQWATVTEYRMQRHQDVFFDLPLGDSIPNDSSCRKLVPFSLQYITLPGRGALGDRRHLNRLQAVPTENPKISKLMPSSGPAAMDYYQFEVDDLKDYWGDKLTFVLTPMTIILRFQISQDVEIRAGPPADGCFFRDGVALTRHIRSFVLDRIK